MPHLLGIDPGFASVGYCVVKLHVEREDPIALGVIETKKSNKKQKVLACEDNFARAQEIAVALSDLIKRYDVQAVCAEAMSFPRNASNAAKMALTWGVLADLCRVHRLSMVQPTPQHIKKALTGNRAASKEEVQAALGRRYPLFESYLMPLPKTKREHATDAFGAIVASLQSDIVKMARRMGV